MKARLLTALALSLALSQFAVTTASAEQASHFRSAPAQTFSAADLQTYGLSRADAAHVASMQAQGYHVQVVSPEQAARMHGGNWGDHRTWWIVGGIIVVVAIVAASN